MTTSDFNSIFSVFVLASWASLLLLADLFVPKDRKWITAWLAILGLVATLVMVLIMSQFTISGFGGMIMLDGFTHFLNVIVILTGIVGILLAMNYLSKNNIDRGEYYSLLLFSVVGMMMMASASDLIVVFLALELLSIPLYILAGFARPRSDSEESAIKYFLLGAFASGFFVYGVALTYGATGATNFKQIVSAVGAMKALDPVLLAGAALILVGLGFKVAAVPFHMWTPDVYEGAPTVVTAFMSVGAKVGGFAALFRVFLTAFPAIAANWAPAVAIIAALTMIVGNTAAIAQSSIKRMLAYSSIAHAGYILMAAVAGGKGSLTEFAASAMLFYLLSYMIMNLGAWSIVIAVEKKQGEGNSIDDFAGLSAKQPLLAIAMALFMFSLMGLPTTVGFVGKVYVFSAAINAGYMWLAVIGVATSLISAFYYLRVIKVMWMSGGESQAVLPIPLKAVVGVTAVATLVLGLLPAPLMDVASRALLSLFRA
ncbi:MAG: NADH-quinone oxidoreductase subunit N [Chloroflexi bacterium]|nr:NADH-quinone oxidoreductase subunit N [Chloroflexota bacterium]